MSLTKVYFPTVPLQEKIARSGGIAREQAVEAATANVRSISGEGDQTIDTALQMLESIVAKSGGASLSPVQMREVLNQGDQIITMAGTFGYTALDKATRSLCDIADGLLRSDQGDLAPIAVHIRAMRLFSPLGVALKADMSNHILAELAKVTAHYNFSSLDKAQ